MQILNTWTSTKTKKDFIEVDEPIYEVGDYRIFHQYGQVWLYTFKNIGINQLAGINKNHLDNVSKMERPTDPLNLFLYERALQNIDRGNNILRE